jgi:vacuolar-type H+-ATPase subunit E/Vma4
MTLEIKRKILNDVYFAFIEKIKNLTLDEYKSWLLKNLNNLDFMNKQGELFIGTANFLENDTFSKEIIDYLSTKNLSSIKITFTQEIDFGFKYVENSVIIDFSLQSIISEIKQNTELKLSKILFN